MKIVNGSVRRPISFSSRLTRLRDSPRDFGRRSRQPSSWTCRRKSCDVSVGFGRCRLRRAASWWSDGERPPTASAPRSFRCTRLGRPSPRSRRRCRTARWHRGTGRSPEAPANRRHRGTARRRCHAEKPGRTDVPLLRAVRSGWPRPWRLRPRFPDRRGCAVEPGVDAGRVVGQHLGHLSGRPHHHLRRRSRAPVRRGRNRGLARTRRPRTGGGSTRRATVHRRRRPPAALPLTSSMVTRTERPAMRRTLPAPPSRPPSCSRSPGPTRRLRDAGGP
jgi:hypothetical protein